MPNDMDVLILLSIAWIGFLVGLVSRLWDREERRYNSDQE